jgi:hypothetical protein
MGNLSPRNTYNRPDVWSWFSHSYGDGNAGSFDQTGRMDAVFRQALDIEFTNWRKYSVSGSRLVVEGASAGGWATLFRVTSGGKFPGKTFPYTGEGGGLVMVFGINDLGTLSGASAQILAAYTHALRAVISRWRASTIKEETDASVVFGGSWTLDTGMQDRASGGAVRWHATTGGTFTITLPADYDGSPISICLTGRNGTNGGTVTYSGTAGVTGTQVTNDVMPAGSLSACATVKRITNLTSANAGQTIIGTVTANTGLVYFDCWWIESKSPPPVIVANVPKLPTSPGYLAKYPSWTTPATGTYDGDVDALNAVITSVCGEFDGMVQIADLDSKLSKTSGYFSDGLHPNDLGAALSADSLLDAVNRLTPNLQYGTSSQMNTPAAKSAAVRTLSRAAFWYGPEYASAGTVAGTAGTMFAMPLQITEARTTWTNWAMEVSGGTSITTGYSLRFGLYNDLNYTGYPDTLLQEMTVSGALSTSTTTGIKTSNAGGFIWKPDPGFYWLVSKIEVVATATTPTLRTAVGPNRYMPNATTTGSINAAGYMAWQLTGQAAGVFPSTFPTGGTLVTSCPVVTMLRG